ncbi:DUF5060 domain-containing protein, partial [bacterium]|nr:DUF5060 domain-containing protein [bacterium]
GPITIWFRIAALLVLAALGAGGCGEGEPVDTGNAILPAKTVPDAPATASEPVAEPVPDADEASPPIVRPSEAGLGEPDTATSYGSDDAGDATTNPPWRATDTTGTTYGTTDATTAGAGYGPGADDARDTTAGTGYGPGADDARDTTAGTGYGTGADDARDTTAGTGYGTGADDARDTTYGADYGTGTGDATYGTTDATTDTAVATRELVYTFSLFDGFDEQRVWASESASDHADISRSEDQVSEGDASLKAIFKSLGKGNFELRREVGLDLTGARMLKVDVHNGCDGPLELKMAFRAGYDTTLFMSPPKVLQAGWNRDMAFPVKEFASEGAGGYGDSWDWSRYSVTRVSLIFGELDQTEGAVHVDNLRFDRPAAELGLRTAPKIKGIDASAAVVERFDPLVLTVDFEADYQDHFDRADVDLTATFFSPSGAKHTVHGFVYDTDAATGAPVWKIRFTPTETGQWRYDVTVKSASGSAASKTYAVNCVHKAERHGFIRRSVTDARYFEFDDDSAALYYPIGQNVCWASDYDHYLAKMQAYGGNYVRVWLCPWNLQLEEPKEPGRYDLRAALALDALIEQCRRRGIAVQLVLRYHGIQGADWAKSPYNTANGGPCTYAGDFFTNAEAKTQHKRFLDYVVARWGHSPTVFAWELWNEADLAKADRETDLLDWHRDMANHLKSIDVNKHLVTTSMSDPNKHMAVFELPNIDFVPVHFYAADVWKRMHDNWVRFRALRKPIFVGEFSSGYKPGDDLKDTTGVHLHAGLWLAFTTPMAGSAMPWWWDTFIDKNDLYSHWAALVKCARGVERRGQNFEVIRDRVKVGEDLQASVQALVSPSMALLWVYDEQRIRQPEQAVRPLLAADRTVKLRGMLGGRFTVEVWDTYAGKILQSSTVEAQDGALVITLPKCDRDVAVKVTHKDGGIRPTLEWE